MVIPELIRLLLLRDINIDEAIDIVSKMCAIHKPHDTGRGTGDLADLVFGESGTAVDPGYQDAGC